VSGISVRFGWLCRACGHENVSEDRWLQNCGGCGDPYVAPSACLCDGPPDLICPVHVSITVESNGVIVRPARFDADRKAKALTILTGRVRSSSSSGFGTTNWPGPGEFHIDLETGKRTDLKSGGDK
jgi:hypothetical protein